MYVNATKLLNALCEKPGRYIEHRTGNYTMREKDGSTVTLTEGGEQIPFPVLEIHVDQLVQHSHVVREDSKYLPRRDRVVK